MPRCPSCERGVSAEASFCEGCGAQLVPNPLEARVRAIVAQGRIIEAIKVYREATGAGLKESKDAVEALIRGEGLPTPDKGSRAIESELLALLGRNEKIEAIKLYRERTGVGLKEAKEAVEDLGRRHGIVAKGSGCAGVLLAAMVLCGALAVVLQGLA